MKNAALLSIFILAAGTMLGCPGKERNPEIPETAEVRNGTEAGAPANPLANLGRGAYALDLVLSAREPFSYRLRISENETDAAVAETEAVLNVRPLHFYCDEEHFVLPVGPAADEFAGPDLPGQRAFLVFRVSDKSFRRYPVLNPDVDNFGVAGGTLFVGNHLAESPNGSVSVIDLTSGKTVDIYHLLEGDARKAIEAFSPVVGLDADGRVKVRLDEFDGRLYEMEGDHLVDSGAGEFTPFENPELPIR